MILFSKECTWYNERKDFTALPQGSVDIKGKEVMMFYIYKHHTRKYDRTISSGR